MSVDIIARALATKSGSGSITNHAQLTNLNYDSSGHIGFQSTANLVTSVDSSSTDLQYPSAKCLYEIIGNIETLLEALL